jgi:hypothetical protein
VLEDSIAICFVIWDAIVPNERIGKTENLATVRRIRKSFRITNHACVENNFPYDRCRRRMAEGKSFKRLPVFEDEVNAFLSWIREKRTLNRFGLDYI